MYEEYHNFIHDQRFNIENTYSQKKAFLNVAIVVDVLLSHFDPAHLYFTYG